MGAVEMRVRSSTTVMVEGSPRPRSSVFSGRTRTYTSTGVGWGRLEAAVMVVESREGGGGGAASTC